MKKTIEITHHKFTRWRLLLLVCTCILSSLAQGEVTLDGSVGPAGALTGPNYQVTENLGKRAGSNLFHSFGRFNLNASESATFSGSSGIKNVISRVTGGQASNIDGTLRVSIPNANLYLLNPAGVIFGEHAKLDVPGSFHVSTADYLKFQDGVRFDSGTATAPQVLATAVPEAFGFLGGNPASISLTGTTGSVLEVQEGSTLSLIGGDITSENTAIVASGGQINIASVGSAGEVSFNESGIQTTSFAQMGDIRISQDPLVPRTVLGTGFIAGNIDASGDTAGRIFIRGGQMVMDNSFIASDTTNGNGGSIKIGLSGDLNLSAPERTLGGLFTGSEIASTTRGEGNAGSISLNVASLNLTDRARINTKAFDNTKGNAGNISINAKTIHLQDEDSDPNRITQITTASFGEGDAGNIAITTDNLEMEGNALIDSNTHSKGKGGDLTINASHLKVINGGKIENKVAKGATGNGGNLTIEANNIFLSGIFTAITTAVQGSGDAGDLAIIADKLELRNGAIIFSTTFDKGNGGNIFVDSGEILLANDKRALNDFTATQLGTGIRSDSFGNNATGNSGNITIKSQNLIASNGASITANLFGEGNGGNLFVESNEILLTNDPDVGQNLGGIRSNSVNGNSGDLVVKANNLVVQNGTSIDASNLGSGNGGDLIVDAGTIILSGDGVTGINNIVFNTGGVGETTVTADNLQILNGASIRTITLGTAKGGNLNVNSGRITISGNEPGVFTGITTQADRSSTGDAGDLTVTASKIELQGSAFISALTTSGGNAGNLLVNVDNLIGNKGALITTQTTGTGNAGNLTVNAKHIELNNGSKIDNSTFGIGRGGILTVNANTILLANNTASERVSGIFSLSKGIEDNAGDSGDLAINANRIEMRDGALITARTEGSGKGGNLIVNANELLLNNANLSSISQFKGTGISQDADAGKSGDIQIKLGSFLRLENNSGIDVSTDRANAGDIRIFGGKFLHLSDSNITTSVADGEGNGGNISINTPIVALDSSDIIARAAEGKGGNISISGFLFQSPSSIVSASSQLGIDGVIDLKPDTNISGSLAVLPDTFLNASQQMSERCAARLGNNLSSFVVKGRGGAPLRPGDLVPSNFLDYSHTEEDSGRGSMNYHSSPYNDRSLSYSDSGKSVKFASSSINCTP